MQRDRGCYGIPSAILPGKSKIRLSTYAGYGSSNTKIPYFTTVDDQIGPAMSLINDSINGAGIVIMVDGLYTFNFAWSGPSGSFPTPGLSKNANAYLSTGITSVTNSQGRLIYSLGAQVTSQESGAVCSYTDYFYAGDIVRPHTTGEIPLSPSRAFFVAVLIAA